MKEAREKQLVTFYGLSSPSYKTINRFSIETLQARREWDDRLTLLTEKSYYQRVICPEKLSFNNEEEIKTFPRRKYAQKVHHH